MGPQARSRSGLALIFQQAEPGVADFFQCLEKRSVIFPRVGNLEVAEHFAGGIELFFELFDA